MQWRAKYATKKACGCTELPWHGLCTLVGKRKSVPLWRFTMNKILALTAAALMLSASMVADSSAPASANTAAPASVSSPVVPTKKAKKVKHVKKTKKAKKTAAPAATTTTAK
jgi:hypothetical protein